MAGICRAGFVAYAISPRNSPAAVAHLLSNTGVVHVLVGSETQDLADASLQIMRESGTVPPDQSRLPTFEDLYFVNLDSEFDPLPPLRYDWNDPLVILHSSGEPDSRPTSTTQFLRILTLRFDRFSETNRLDT